MTKQFLTENLRINNVEQSCNSNIPIIYKNWAVSGKPTEWSNHISHPKPINPNREEWHNSYLSELLHMYDIVANTIDERYPKNKIHWSYNKKVAHNLSRLIYHCSSKQLPKE